MTCYLIVNADDFGQSPGINAGVIRAHRSGVVTSASLMVRWPAAVEAAQLAIENPALSVGLHLDLGQWSYDAGWVADYVVVDPEDEAAVTAEVERQIDRFHDLMGRGPTHMDGHQHVQRTEPAGTVVTKAASELGVPVRLHGPVMYSGALYGQTAKGDPYPEALDVDAVLAEVRSFDAGWYELGCHPGLGGDAPGCYRSERSVETTLLCDPRLRDGLSAAGVALRSFADFAGTGGQI